MHKAKPWGWDIEGISPPSLPACLLWRWQGSLGDSEHVAGTDVAAWPCGSPRGLGQNVNPAGVGFWGAARWRETTCHVMVGFLLSDALERSLLTGGGREISLCYWPVLANQGAQASLSCCPLACSLITGS